MSYDGPSILQVKILVALVYYVAPIAAVVAIIAIAMLWKKR